MAQGNHRASRALPEIDADAIVRAYEDGEQIVPLARRYRCRATRITNILRAAEHDTWGTGQMRARRTQRGRSRRPQEGYPSLAHVTPLEWAYTAGIFDGEGCLTTFPNGRYRLIVVQNGPELSRWLKVRFGGATRCARRAGLHISKAGEPSKEHWHWSLVAQLEVLAVLRGMVPFLILKSDAASSAVNDLEKRYAAWI